MNWTLSLIAVSALLCSCTGFQIVKDNPDGTTTVAQFDATASEGEASAREVVTRNGTIIRSVQQRYDGTRVIGTIADAGTARIGIREFSKSDRITREFDGQAKVKGTRDPNITPPLPLDPNKAPDLPLDPNQ